MQPQLQFTLWSSQEMKVDTNRRINTVLKMVWSTSAPVLLLAQVHHLLYFRFNVFYWVTMERADKECVLLKFLLTFRAVAHSLRKTPPCQIYVNNHLCTPHIVTHRFYNVAHFVTKTWSTVRPRAVEIKNSLRLTMKQKEQGELWNKVKKDFQRWP